MITIWIFKMRYGDDYQHTADFWKTQCKCFFSWPHKLGSFVPIFQVSRRMIAQRPRSGLSELINIDRQDKDGGFARSANAWTCLWAQLHCWTNIVYWKFAPLVSCLNCRSVIQNDDKKILALHSLYRPIEIVNSMSRDFWAIKKHLKAIVYYLRFI